MSDLTLIGSGAVGAALTTPFERALAAHLVGDWPLQNDWMAHHKARPACFRAPRPMLAAQGSSVRRRRDAIARRELGPSELLVSFHEVAARGFEPAHRGLLLLREDVVARERLPRRLRRLALP